MWPLFVAISLVGAAATDDSLVVKTDKGSVRGITMTAATGKQVDAWWGIPFAEKPLGNLRFRRPEAVKQSWNATLNATTMPNSCIQTMDTLFGNFTGSTMWNANTPISEDCLYVNVIVPKPRPTKAAVMVWIYGGGYYCGTSTLEVYDPKILVSEENVIVVSFQHRVASLGFLYLGRDVLPGNAGLYDQIMALEWVQKNIEKFGGDPKNVTLFGESSGASSISYLMNSVNSSKLFHKAILQSGTFLSPWASISEEELKSRSLKLAGLVQCNNTTNITATLTCLQNANATDLVYKEWQTRNNGLCKFPFVPTVDGDLIKHSPSKDLSTDIQKMPLLLGSNTEEGYYFLIYFLTNLFNLNETITITNSSFSEAVNKIHPNASKETVKNLMDHYINVKDRNDSKKNSAALDKMAGDYQITCPSHNFAGSYLNISSDVYLYLFAHKSTNDPWPKWIGVMHGNEINYVFGEPLNSTMAYEESEKALSRRIMKYWANFAKSGNPNTDGQNVTNISWPKFDNDKKDYIVLSLNNTSTTNFTVKNQHCNFLSTQEKLY